MDLRQRFRFVLLPSIVLLGVPLGCASSHPKSDDPAVQDYLTSAEAILQEDGVPGAAIALVVKGKTAFTGGVGVTRLGGEEVSEDSLFAIGSDTKLLTGLTALSLTGSSGVLDLDAPVTRYLPLKVPPPFSADHITMRGLLSHTAGIADNSSEDCVSYTRFSDLTSSTVPVWADQGTVWDYSNLGYSVAGSVLEGATGESYEQLVHDRVLVPAHMTTTTFDGKQVQANPHHAVGYVKDSSGALTVPVEPTELTAACPVVEPAGDAFASARDYAGLIAALLNGGGDILGKEAMATLTTPVAETRQVPQVDERYGYGLFFETVQGQTMMQHGGDLPPFHSLLVLLPNRGFGVMAMVNGDSPLTAAKLALQAVKAFTDFPLSVTPVTTLASTWTEYDGTYVDPYGSLGEVVVKATGSALEATVTTTIEGQSQVVHGELKQLSGDAWVFSAKELTVSVGVVFWRDDNGKPELAVTRMGIGRRK